MSRSKKRGKAKEKLKKGQKEAGGSVLLECMGEGEATLLDNIMRKA